MIKEQEAEMVVGSCVWDSVNEPEKPAAAVQASVTMMTDLADLLFILCENETSLL